MNDDRGFIDDDDRGFVDDDDRGFVDGELLETIKTLLPPKSEIRFISPTRIDIHTTYRINDHVIEVGFTVGLDVYRAGLLKNAIQKSAQQAMGFYINSLFEL